MPGLQPDELLQNLTPYFQPTGAGISFIAENILTSSVATVTFDNIPPDYRHIISLSILRSDRAAELDTLGVQFNGDTGNNYDRHLASFNTAAVYNIDRAINHMKIGLFAAANATASLFDSIFIIFPYYHGSQLKESIAVGPTFGDVSADADVYISLGGAKWRNTDAVTSITFFAGIGNIVAGSSIALYGVY